MKPSERLRAWLEEQVRVRRPGAALPNARELARDWQVSPSTVARVLAPYQRRGDIVRIPRKGTFVGPVEPHPASESRPSRTSVQSIVDQVKRSIANGSIRKGDALPSIKFMSRQFKVAPRTVIAAYRELARQTHVVQIGKTYWVGSFELLTKRLRNREVYLIRKNGDDFDQMFLDPIFGLTFHKMVKELENHGMLVRFAALDSLPTLLGQWRARSARPAAVVFHQVERDASPALVREAHHPHQSLTVPVLVDIGGGDYRRLPRTIVMLSRGNVDTSFARTVARYVTATGNRTVRLFMHFDRNNISLLFVLLKIRTELQAFDPSLRTRVYITTARETMTREDFLALFSSIIPAQRQDAVFSKYQKTSIAEVESEVEFVGPAPLPFGRIERGVWFFGSESQAVEARQWAHTNRVEIPQELSIISLSASPYNYHHGISSCALDWDSAGYLLAHALLGDISYEKTRKGFIRMPVALTHRGTTLVT